MINMDYPQGTLQRVDYSKMQELETPKDELWIDPTIKENLDIVKKRVLTKDRDFIAVIDGEEGSGKSVLAQQIAKYLDPEFNLDKIVFNSDQFLKLIKDPKTKKGSCIVLDEAFSAANSRSSLTEVNRAMIGVATEMRQKNLFVLMCIPSFFDLDRYFAIWRCRALFHVYFTEDEDRRYIVFNKNQKKMLYLLGKKTYSYSKPRLNMTPCNFPHYYTVNEEEYRAKKAEAFKKRIVSQQARNWMNQRNCLIKYMIKNLGTSQTDIDRIFKNANVPSLTQQAVSLILKELEEESE